MKEFKGFGKVFSFTVGQMMKRKSFRTTFVLIAILCLLAPPLIMSLVEMNAMKEGTAGTGENTAVSTKIEKVVVVDTDQEHPVDYEILNQEGTGDFAKLAYETAADLNAGVSAAGGGKAVVLFVEKSGADEAEERYQINVLLPYGTDIQKKDAEGYESFVSDHFQTILNHKSGLTEEQQEIMENPVQAAAYSMKAAEEGGDQFAPVKRVLSFLLPYLLIMGLYFMILFYGQNVANSVLLEKSSKLMDNLLICVKPAALVMGKMLAIFVTGVLQTMFWIICLVGGFTVGCACVRAINPDTTMVLVQFLGSLSLFSGIFSIGGILFAIAVFLAGFLLYCSLAALGGSLASKQEDLGTTNMLFTMALVISFMATLFGGVLEGNITDWMLYIPFTAVLTAPGEALLGNLSVLQGSISLGILIATTIVVVWVAGRVYTMLVMYKGNPPSFGKIVKMIRNK
jgi:ABC-type Na+ efflux pump permease subunit